MAGEIRSLEDSIAEIDTLHILSCYFLLPTECVYLMLWDWPWPPLSPSRQQEALLMKIPNWTFGRRTRVQFRLYSTGIKSEKWLSSLWRWAKNKELFANNKSFLHDTSDAEIRQTTSFARYFSFLEALEKRKKEKDIQSEKGDLKILGKRRHFFILVSKWLHISYICRLF